MQRIIEHISFVFSAPCVFLRMLFDVTISMEVEKHKYLRNKDYGVP